ncbi:MAG: hypothetical protein WHX93_14925 [bacterium]
MRWLSKVYIHEPKEDQVKYLHVLMAIDLLVKYAIHHGLGTQSVIATTAIHERTNQILKAASIPKPEKIITSQLLT